MTRPNDTPDQSGRRFLALSAIGATAPFLGTRPLRAQTTNLVEINTIPEKLKGTGEVRIAAYGGTAQDAERKAYFEPFEKLSGIKTRDFAGADINKVKAMVETGNVEWDVVQLSRSTVRNLMKKGDYFEKIDYDLVDTANIDPVYRYDYALDMLVWSEVMAYRTDAFKGAVPNGWADFWDAKKFPGDRALGGAGPSTPELEFALMAAGVPPDKIYPIDIDKAFASYDKIKTSVVKWWETGAVPVQLLTDREVVLTSVWNGRMAAIQAAGVPAAISWNQGLLKRDAWAVPKGSPNQGQCDEVHRIQHAANPPGASFNADPLRLLQQQGCGIRAAEPTGTTAQCAGDQVAASNLQLRLVGGQSRHCHRAVEQVDSGLSSASASWTEPP